MTIIGIDPGATGWVVALDSDGIAWSRPLPQDPVPLADLLREHAGATVAVERQQAMRREGAPQGAASTFALGQGYGQILGVLAALGCRVILVRPQDWQRAMLRGEPKAVSRRERLETYVRVAERLWPRVSFRGPRGGLLDGKAAAALLAEYYRLEVRHG